MFRQGDIQFMMTPLFCYICFVVQCLAQKTHKKKGEGGWLFKEMRYRAGYDHVFASNPGQAKLEKRGAPGRGHGHGRWHTRNGGRKGLGSYYYHEDVRIQSTWSTVCSNHQLEQGVLLVMRWWLLRFSCCCALLPPLPPSPPWLYVYICLFRSLQWSIVTKDGKYGW